MKKIITTFFFPIYFTFFNVGLYGAPIDWLKKTGLSNLKSNIHRVFADTGIVPVKIANDTPKLISNQFQFTEGPASDAKGNIYFTDQPNNCIWEYDTNGKLTIFMNHAGRSNGMYFDTKGNLITCADEKNQLWSISPKKNVIIILGNFKGRIFNGPNDVWVNPVNNGIYFTDPYYKRGYWKSDHPHMRAQRVYYLAGNKKKPIIVEEALQKPNGLIGSPDGKILYIADIEANKTYKYAINRYGSLSNKQLFVNQGSDGMTIDNDGNIYLTGTGVTVYNKEGKLIQQIPVPEPWTANVCIGGKNHDTLFITASKSFYKLPLHSKKVD
jgi:gluconolactonase